MITTPPHSNLTTTALDFIRTALENGVDVIGIFFYQDGVLNASKHLSMPNDEFQTNAHWQQLHSDFNLPLYLCISAAQKRGLSDEILQESDSNIDNSLADSTDKNNSSNIVDIFTIAGLGELVTLSSVADKVVQF